MSFVDRIGCKAMLAAVGMAGLAMAPAASAQESVPYRPVPPAGADYRMQIPAVAADGTRMTLNKGLSAEETLWHVRSGWNVAALNCLGQEYQPILDGYRVFLKKYDGKLAATNNALEMQYRKTASSADAGIRNRERVSTQVYNYFALPLARTGFCDAALRVSSEFLASPPADPEAFAAATLPRFEAPFETFFAEYDQYRMESAAWDQRYGAQYGYSQPGYVAVHSYGGGLSVAAAVSAQAAGR
jgi:hypothetical protein